MLPGIRFLLAAILLSMSILIFGLGAAALLRAAHEEVASVPTRRILPEPVFAQQPEAPAAALAMLRIEPAAPAKAPDDAPAAIPAPEPALEAAPVPAVETDKLAALKTDDIAPAEAERSEAAAKPEAALNSETAATETPPLLPAAAAEPPPATETKLASLDAAPSPPTEGAPVPSVTSDASATTTAALGDLAAAIENTADATAAKEKADRNELRKQRRAERARERRRQAARRARLAAQQAAAAAAQQQALNPFMQMTQAVVQPVKPAATTTQRR
jgi:hypothetical protein